MKNVLKIAGIFCLLSICSSSLSGQTGFYKNGEIHEVKFTFSQTNWDYLLDSFYVDGDEERLMASIEIDGDQYDSVGIRYKGFSSVSVNRRKNPFNIKLDFLKEQDHNGVDKIKLSNVIQDPSFVREALTYEIARKYMPASGANYVKLYINNVYWGVYTSVQDVDKGFLRTHFGSGENTFVKGNPESLDLNGENCNLSNTPGTDSSDYTSLYEMKSDYGYGDLYELVDILNNNPANIETVLNVDRTLWMHALNYVMVNFDSYVGYAQNYYLYKDDKGQFNPILWDLNQSFASFRLTDASDYFQGFSVNAAKQIDPLSHHSSTSVYARPLMRNLFVNDRYRKMYLAHIRTIVEENFANSLYKARATDLQIAIDASVLADTNKFYTYADFKANLNSTVTDLVDYPGITDLMDARTTYLKNYAGYNGGPVLQQPSHSVSGNDLIITANASNATDVILAYRDDNSTLFIKEIMYDDGLHNDGASGDGIYGALVQNKEVLQYYVYAENAMAGAFSPARAAYEFYTIRRTVPVAINEICASNDATIADPQGDYDDWVELYNNTSSPINLKGYYLSDDNSELKKWTFPDTFIAANDYLLIWTDSDDGDEGLHASFKLSAAGEALFLSDTSGTIVDEITFGAIETDITFGRAPNGVGDFHMMNPTPQAFNGASINTPKIISEKDIKVYPIPTNEMLTVEIESGSYNMSLTDIAGRVLQQMQISAAKNKLDVSHLKPGFYFLVFTDKNLRLTQKIIIE